jgi:outer membrane protein OmpA-like peptidoglycan-associated protein
MIRATCGDAMRGGAIAHWTTAIVAGLGPLLLILSCNGGVDVGRYVGLSADLVATARARLEPVAAKLPDLARRVELLPSGIPGAAEASASVRDNQAHLDRMRRFLAEVSPRVSSAAEAGSPIDADRALISAEQAFESMLVGLRIDIEASARQVAEVETRAKEVVAAVAGNDMATRLLGVINDRAHPLDKSVWLAVEGITFVARGAELDLAASKPSLDALVEILGAYPAVKLKLAGYTDNSGQPEANRRTSQARADAVRRYLIWAGVDADRLEAEGYGEAYPVCSANDTDECRARNGRLEVGVRAR